MYKKAGVVEFHDTDEMVKAYIEGHTETEDQFRITDGFEPK